MLQERLGVLHITTKKHDHDADINFDNDKCITWHFIDGSTKKLHHSNTIQKETLAINL